MIDTAGALVVGRHLFDVTNGWEGRHPIDVPVVVVTHDPPTDWQPAEPDPRFAFVTEGVEAAVARARGARGRQGRSRQRRQMARQALEAGLIDELWVDLVPLLLGGGPPIFDQVKAPGLARRPALGGGRARPSPTCATASGARRVWVPIARQQREGAQRRG